MKTKEKKFKYDDKTKFTVVREIIINDVKDENGVRYLQKAHVEENPNPNELFEIGSVRKPKNEDVIELKWIVPHERNPFGLFKK